MLTDGVYRKTIDQWQRERRMATGLLLCLKIGDLNDKLNGQAMLGKIGQIKVLDDFK